MPSLTENEMKKFSVIFVANEDIECGSMLFEKGTLLGAEDIGTKPYRVGFSTTGVFPKNALLLRFSQRFGLSIYPNGKFISDTAHIVSVDSISGEWRLQSNWSLCKTSANPPFSIMKN
nr:hypothetical protein [Sulfurimonas sp. SAG-AH-194-C20]